MVTRSRGHVSTKSFKKKDALINAYKNHSSFSSIYKKYMTIGKLLKRSFRLCKSRFFNFNIEGLTIVMGKIVKLIEEVLLVYRLELSTSHLDMSFFWMK